MKNKTCFYHSEKCERITGGKCNNCVRGNLGKEYPYKWVGTTWDEEWGNLRANQLDFFKETEFLYGTNI